VTTSTAEHPSRYHFTDETPFTVNTAEGAKLLGKGWLAITEEEYAELSAATLGVMRASKATIPDSPEEWALEQAAFHANRDGVPDDVREVIKQLWAEVVAREEWLSATPLTPSSSETVLREGLVQISIGRRINAPHSDCLCHLCASSPGRLRDIASTTLAASAVARKIDKGQPSGA
jgi:hypothetical protein